MTTKPLFTAVVLVGLVYGTSLAQPSDPLVGKWTLNAAKSKGSKSGSTTIEAAGKGVKFRVDYVSADGTAGHWEFTANFDGNDYPVTGNSPYGNAVMLTRVDAKTIRITSKHDGKVMATTTIVVSDDGKTRTSTTKGTNVKGQPVDVVNVYEKQ